MRANTIKTFSGLDRVAAAQKRHLVSDWVVGGLFALGMLYGIAAIESSAQALTVTPASKAAPVLAVPAPAHCDDLDLPSC